MKADVEIPQVTGHHLDVAVSVATRSRLAYSRQQVWEALLLYEEIEGHPPWPLRLLLPIPIRNGGRVSRAGEAVECLYEGGRLLKRLTRVHENELYEFEITEQELRIVGGVVLSGGSYTLREIDNGGTEVSVETRYLGGWRPRWLWEPVERAVCRAFHRYLLRVIQHRAKAR